MEKVSDKIKNEPIIYMFRKMWKFAGPNRKWVVLVVVMHVFAQLTLLAEPLIFAEFMNELQVNGINGENITYLISILSLIIIFIFIFWAFHGVARIIERRNAYKIDVAYEMFLLRGVFDFNLAWHGERDSGDTIDKINKASTALYRFSAGMFQFVRIVVGLIGATVLLYIFSPAIGLTAFIVTVLIISILFRFDKILIPQYKEMIKGDNKISAGIFDALSNISSVFILHVQNPVLSNIEKLMWKPWNISKKNINMVEFKWFSGDVSFKILTVVPIMFYIYNIYGTGGAVMIGSVTALYMYLGRMSRSFYTLADLYENTLLRKTNVENAEEIEMAIEENQSKSATKKIVQDWKELQISNLNFSYEGSRVEQKDLHLDSVNISIKKGHKVAFIGESGSGKTTFLKVLHGLYDTASAGLRLDDSGSTTTNFTDIDLATMLVPQEPEIFSSTIKENITLGLPTKKEEIERVLKLARFDDVVDKLPKGLKSVINEKGVNLSGGQKQRLALARALLFARDKEILLLDESTSSVDPENEAYIYESIFKEYTGKTILASIHKMNLLKYFDRVVMFKDGKVVDEGSFEELLKKNQKFKADWDTFVKSNV